MRDLLRLRDSGEDRREIDELLISFVAVRWGTVLARQYEGAWMWLTAFKYTNISMPPPPRVAEGLAVKGIQNV
jgi:hypothetical protein